jgi:type VI secretion system protein ImpH
MARARRGQTPPLIDLLAREPHRFDTRQAVRVLELHREITDGAEVRFRSSLSLAFPVSDIESVSVPPLPKHPREAKQHAVVTVSFLGLGGASGPLPAPYTEFLAAAARRRDTTGRDFLDLFNHRLVTAAMDLARLYRPALQRGPPQDSNLARQCFALMGLGTPHIRTAIADRAPALLPLAALVNQRPLSAHAIEQAVNAHLGFAYLGPRPRDQARRARLAHARVVPFRGGWLRVPREQRTALGRNGRNRRLGRDAMLGGKLWEQSAGIVLALGPMAIEEAERLFPTARGKRYRDLAGLLDFLVGGEVEIDLRLLVTTASIRPSRLVRRDPEIGADAPAAARPWRLGWNSWLTRDAAARRDGAVLGRTARLGGGVDGKAAPARLGGRAAPEIRVVALPLGPVPPAS